MHGVIQPLTSEEGTKRKRGECKNEFQNVHWILGLTVRPKHGQWTRFTCVAREWRIVNRKVSL